MEQLNFGQAKSLTNQVSRRTTDEPIVSATPTEGNCRISAVGGELIGASHEEITSEEGQYVEVKVMGEGDDRRVFIAIVPEGAQDNVRGAKLAQPQQGSNLMFSNKSIYKALNGHPSSDDEDQTYNVRWDIDDEAIEWTDDNGNDWTFYELTFKDKVGSAKGKAAAEADAEEESAEVDFE